MLAMDNKELCDRVALTLGSTQRTGSLTPSSELVLIFHIGPDIREILFPEQSLSTIIK